MNSGEKQQVLNASAENSPIKVLQKAPSVPVHEEIKTEVVQQDPVDEANLAKGGHKRNKSDYLQKVQALPRNSIKNNKYNFGDILGDINYIGDDKLPTFQSRGLRAK